MAVLLDMSAVEEQILRRPAVLRERRSLGRLRNRCLLLLSEGVGNQLSSVGVINAHPDSEYSILVFI